MASKSVWPDKPGPKVVVTFPPIACFAAKVMGDRGTLRGVMSSQGPHEYVESVKDAETVNGAELFFINGLELDTTISKKMLASAGNKKCKMIDLGSKFDEKKLLEGECNHEGHNHAHEHGIDAHVWLGPDMAIKMTEVIRDELKIADPTAAAEYDARASKFIEELTKLQNDGVAMLKGKENRKIITMHESLAYFARAYDIDIAGSIQATPGQEPAKKKFDQLINTIVNKKVSVLAIEPQYVSSNAIQTIQRELKAKGLPEITVIQVDPFETDTSTTPSPDTYEKKMRANLEAIAKGLK